jgi:hypothetical protein
MADRETKAEDPEKDVNHSQVALKEGEDFYYDGPYMVFTEQYHLKRGTCCQSGCRHCPYKGKS